MAKTIQDDKSIHAVILDFTKAFDKVPHARLIKKLEYYGIRGPLLTWFESFLKNRTQSVVCDGKHSEPSFVTSGVPQGTVLGPLLFLLYINDLPDNFKSSIKLFVDDALLYEVMTNEENGDQLQEDLQQLEVWQCKWKIVFNPTKCKIICISTKKTPPQRKYTFCGVELEQVNSFSYLGVTITEDMKWSKHITSIAGKESGVLGMIKRNLWSCPKDVKVTAYKALVPPKLEYASTAWDPYLQKDILALEKVQRKAARFCTNNHHPTVSLTEMLEDLGWHTLEQRRNMNRLSLFYKISRSEASVNVPEMRLHTNHRTRTSHAYKYYSIRATKNIFFHSFFPRTVRSWNKLSVEIAGAKLLSHLNSKLSELF